MNKIEPHYLNREILHGELPKFVPCSACPFCTDASIDSLKTDTFQCTKYNEPLSCSYDHVENTVEVYFHRGVGRFAVRVEFCEFFDWHRHIALMKTKCTMDIESVTKEMAYRINELHDKNDHLELAEKHITHYEKERDAIVQTLSASAITLMEATQFLAGKPWTYFTERLAQVSVPILALIYQNLKRIYYTGWDLMKWLADKVEARFGDMIM